MNTTAVLEQGSMSVCYTLYAMATPHSVVLICLIQTLYCSVKVDRSHHYFLNLS